MLSSAVPQAEPIVECKLATEYHDGLAKSSLWWDRYDREHSWTHARRAALDRGTCERCGSDGSPPQAELDALGPMPSVSERSAWQIKRDHLRRKHALTVVHRVPVAGDPFKDGCQHHGENLAVLCGACAANA